MVKQTEKEERRRILERSREFDERRNKLVEDINQLDDARVRYDVEVEQVMSMTDAFRERVDRLHSATDREFLEGKPQLEEDERRLRAKLDDAEARQTTKQQ
ncbi:MAG: hypothetical protein KY455_06730 [Euryarchaeota archaeon]|nr:hypothetical protein [Euryarchaeota archaeon]